MTDRPPHPELVEIEVESVQEVTPHNQALYEAGKKLLVESVDVSREFCKFMIGISTGAIPIYLGLLKLILPDGYKSSSWIDLLFVAPVVFFMSASLLFALGYFPRHGETSLDLIEEIRRERNSTILRHRRYSIFGFSTFFLGVLLAVGLVFWGFSPYRTHGKKPLRYRPIVPHQEYAERVFPADITRRSFVALGNAAETGVRQGV